mmetsp:Transcript_1024/g.2369  ORF Transcript_1024/g.2369 Transcript_1024/m.2369 type:complete len:174 (-) Transcript_1024:290-811(-)
MQYGYQQYRTMSPEEADRIFRQQFGNRPVHEIFREQEQHMRAVSDQNRINMQRLRESLAKERSPARRALLMSQISLLERQNQQVYTRMTQLKNAMGMQWQEDFMRRQFAETLQQQQDIARLRTFSRFWAGISAMLLFGIGKFSIVAAIVWYFLMSKFVMPLVYILSRVKKLRK